MTDLVPLDEYNKLAFERHLRAKDNPTATGIACPRCGSELHDKYKDVVLTSSPPQKNVVCFTCGYTGLRIV